MIGWIAVWRLAAATATAATATAATATAATATGPILHADGRLFNTLVNAVGCEHCWALVLLHSPSPPFIAVYLHSVYLRRPGHWNKEHLGDDPCQRRQRAKRGAPQRVR